MTPFTILNAIAEKPIQIIIILLITVILSSIGVGWSQMASNPKNKIFIGNCTTIWLSFVFFLLFVILLTNPNI